MYKILSILILLSTTMCYGQGRYKVCKIYYEDSRDTSLSGLKTLQLYNTYGKIVFEKEYGEYKLIDDKGYTDYSDTSKYHSKKHYYYIQDTILHQSIEYKFEFLLGINDGVGVDTIIELFYSDYTNRLVKKAYTCYTNQLFGSCLPAPYKTWGDTIADYYRYDNNGNILIDSIDIKPNIFSFDSKFHDSTSNLVHDEYHAKEKTKHIVTVHRYQYNSNNQLISKVIEDEWEPERYDYIYNPGGYNIIHTTRDGYKDTTIVGITYDKSNRVIEQTEHKVGYENTMRIVFGYFPDKRILNETTYCEPGINKYNFESRQPYTLTTRYVYE